MPFVDSLAHEIGRALQYFFTQHAAPQGALRDAGRRHRARCPALRERVKDVTGFASKVVNPFESMKLGSAVREAKLRREAPSYLTACGLAMRRFVQ